MFKKDFTKAVYEHVSDLAYSEEIPAEITCNYVGWLGDSTPSANHEIPDGFLDTLVHYKNYHYVDGAEMGFHTCEICEQCDDRGEFLIQMGVTFISCPIAGALPITRRCRPRARISPRRSHPRSSAALGRTRTR